MSFASRVGSLSLLVAALGAALPAGCRSDAQRQPGKAVRVAVGLAPVADLARRIGADRAEVRTLLPPTGNPHSYTPTARDLVWVESAQLAVLLETPFEQVLAGKLAGAIESLRILRPARSTGTPEDSARDPADDHGDHDHGHHGHEHPPEASDDPGHAHGPHGHPGGDPHVWLSPRIMRDRIAPAIAEALAEEAPEFAETYRRNLRQVQQTLTDLDERIARQLKPLKGRTFYTYHAAFGHFAQAYGLEQESIELEGKSPSPRRVHELIERARAEGVRVIFVQKRFPSQSAEAIAEAIGGAVVPLDPLGQDYIRTMEDLASALERGLDQAETP